MTSRIPQNGLFYQPNKGDIFGNIFSTRNIDLKTNPGRIRISPRLVAAVKDNDSGITGMGIPGAFAFFKNQYWAMCGIGAGATTGSGKILRSDDTEFTSDWDNDGGTGTPVVVHEDYSDMLMWNNGRTYSTNKIGDALLVSTFDSTTSQIKKLYTTDTTWVTDWFTNAATVNGSFRNNGNPKNMWIGPNKNLYITDDDLVIYVPFNTGASATEADAQLSSTGTVDTNGSYNVLWGMANSTDNWMAFMDYGGGKGAKGYMARWDGSGTAAQKIYKIDAPCALAGCILDDVPYIIDAFGRLKRYNATGFVEIARLPVANLNIEMPGIYNGSTNSRWIRPRGMSVVDGKINIVVNNFVSSGVYVNDMPSGVWELNMDNPSQPFLYHKNSPCADTNDYGQELISNAGAIFGTRRSTGSYLAGFGYYSDNAVTQRFGVFYDDVVSGTDKRGSITLPFIRAEQITDSFTGMAVSNSPLMAGEEIVGKFRTKKNSNFPFVADAVWTSTTTFTSTDVKFANVAEKDEIEVVMGKRSGTSAHVSSIVLVSSTYTITLEDTIGSASGNCKVRVRNFKKSTFSAVDGNTSAVFPLGDIDTKLQPKLEIRGAGDIEVDDITLINKGFQLTK